MNIMELGAIGELVGGVAVIATLVYLAVQVRHARRQVGEQSIATAVQMISTAFEPLYYGENFRIIHKGLVNRGNLDDDEQFVFDALLSRQLSAIPLLNRADEPWVREFVGAIEHHFFTQPGGQEWLREFVETWPDGEFKTMVSEAFPSLLDPGTRH